jgi:hypothetical protein
MSDVRGSGTRPHALMLIGAALTTISGALFLLSVAHRHSPHARIACTACHVGSGAPSFVQAKPGGVRRLAAVVRDSYERPVAVPVRDLPAPRDTCEGCPAADAYVGDRARRVPSYADDQPNTDQGRTLTLLGCYYRPYTANTVWLKLTYLW